MQLKGAQQSKSFVIATGNTANFLTNFLIANSFISSAVFHIQNRLEQTMTKQRMYASIADLPDPDDDRLTPEQAEEMMRVRWEEKMKNERERQMRSMQRFVKMWQHKALLPCFHNWKGWTR